MDEQIIEVSGVKTKISLFPESTIQEIAQNIRMILTTIAGTVPLNRNFGLDASFLDEPHPRAMMKMAISIAESIQQYEPRAQVKEVDFVPSLDEALSGKLIPKVKVVILDEFLA